MKTMQSECQKERFRTESAAVGRAKAVQRARGRIWPFGAYRCETCRFDDGQRAWHLGKPTCPPVPAQAWVVPMTAPGAGLVWAVSPVLSRPVDPRELQDITALDVSDPQPEEGER